MRMRRYAEGRRSELRPNRLTASGKWLVALKPVVYINEAEQTIQETSEPIVENGAVLEENPDPTAAFVYDDDEEGAFAGFDDDYDDDFMLNSNPQGTT